MSGNRDIRLAAFNWLAKQVDAHDGLGEHDQDVLVHDEQGATFAVS